MKYLVMLALLASMSLTGCATIVGDDTQRVQVNSNPAGAHFAISDETGKVVAQGITPQDVTLEKSNGDYFGKKGYQVTFTRKNYQPTTLPIKAEANGWYIGGNLVSFNVIGYLLVDPFNGGMYTLKPESIDAPLALTASPLVMQ